eukprot:Em0015g132a
MSSAENQNDEAERETLKKEFVWLLENEYTRKVADIKRSMEECAKKFVPVFQPVTSDKDIRPIIFRPSQTGDDSISYKVSLDGDQIWRATLLSASWSKNSQDWHQGAFAWKLKQAFGDFISTLRQAVEVLVVPQLPDVKEVYSAELRGQLKPELPEDVALFFYISSDSLVLSVLIAATTQKGNTVSSPVRWLQDVLAFIKDAQELAQELIDKVQTFDAYGLEE